MKIFDNPRNLSEAVIYWRLFALDPNVVVELYDSGTAHFVKVSSIATDAQIDAKLTALNDAGDTIAARLAAARAAGAIPSWASWTQADWMTYYSANISATQINAITTLAEARAMLLKMSNVINNIAQLEIALRNRVFPDL